MKARYKRMLAALPEGGPREWSVYVVRCADGSLYTGIAKDLKARLALHNGGRGAAYTRTRRPVTVVSSASGFTRSEALSREAWVKSLPREEKALALADPNGGGYNVARRGMNKRKPPTAGKKPKAAPKKKEPAPEADPEMDHLQERFQSMSVDFGKLAEMIDEEKPA